MRVHKIHQCSGHRGAVYTLAPDVANNDGFYSAGGDGWIVKWVLENPDMGKVVASVEDRIFCLLLMSHPDRLLAGNMTGGLHWIHLDNPDASLNIQHHRKGIFDVLQSGDSVFTAGGDGVLTRWSATHEKTIESIHLSGASLRCIAKAPQGDWLAVGASDGHIYIIGVNDMRLISTINNAHANSVFSVAFSNDGQMLFSGGRDAVLRQWQRSEDGFIFSEEVAAPWYTINHIAMRPDGQIFATASRDKTIKIWETSTCRLIKVLDVIRDGGHINSVNRLLWLADNILVSAGDDRSAIIWSVETD
ncbi:MAG: hypothetical protein IT269_11175 [Saprospiraceae bacterium]|nr:hypothetical protein [Saprospiraceae bacterium]